VETVTLAGGQEALVGECSCGAWFGQRLQRIDAHSEGNE